MPISRYVDEVGSSVTLRHMTVVIYTAGHKPFIRYHQQHFQISGLGALLFGPRRGPAGAWAWLAKRLLY